LLTRIVLCGVLYSAAAVAQIPAAGEKKVINQGDYAIEVESVEEVKRDLVHTDKSPESYADFSKMNLRDLNGKDYTVPTDKVTVIEYWSIKSAPSNLFWARARELEKKYAQENGFQLLSVNYDYVRSGQIQIDAVKEFLTDYSKPEQVVIDADDGLRDIFLMRGPISYLLINHKGVYTYTFRGDDPDSAEFFEHVENAIDFMRNEDAYGPLPKAQP